MQLSVCLRHCRHQVSRYPQSAALCSFRYPTIKKLVFDAVGNGKVGILLIRLVLQTTECWSLRVASKHSEIYASFDPYLGATNIRHELSYSPFHPPAFLAL